MPKTGMKSVFDSQLAFICRDSLRVNMVAIAYLRGDNGAYASVARYLLERAVEDFVRDLDVDERRKFDQIHANVKKMELTSRVMKEERFPSRASIRGPRVDKEYVKMDPGRVKGDTPD